MAEDIRSLASGGCADGVGKSHIERAMDSDESLLRDKASEKTAEERSVWRPQSPGMLTAAMRAPWNMDVVKASRLSKGMLFPEHSSNYNNQQETGQPCALENVRLTKPSAMAPGSRSDPPSMWLSRLSRWPCQRTPRCFSSYHTQRWCEHNFSRVHRGPRASRIPDKTIHALGCSKTLPESLT